MVLVVESPFSARDAERFGVTDLRAAGLAVEVWEIADLTLPDARRQWFEPSPDVAIERVGTWDRFEELAGRLTSDDAVVLICGVYAPLSAKYSALLKRILDSQALVGTLASGTIPPPVGTQRLRAWAYASLKKLQALARPPVEVPRALDFVWAGTTVKAVASELRDARTTCRFIHTLDADLLLAVEPRAIREQFALIVDTMGPFHPDYVSQGMENPWPPDCYQSIVQSVSEGLTARGLEVVVAAHPRAKPGSLDALYPGLQVVHGRTPELLASCAFAIAIEGSTSLGMAAYLQTPVLFVNAPCVPAFVAGIAASFRRAMHAPNAAVGELSSVAMPPLVDQAALARYVRRYVKSAGSPDRRFWSVVAADILDSPRD
ncbi:MAG: hypothetical protein Q7V58_05140 [Actinomycetota bacterium]|nr:hypothetical protein [Actinomycetota bacterium]